MGLRFDGLKRWMSATLSNGSKLDWIAIVISLMSLLGTVYWSSLQYELSREHNKQSVKPIINFYIFNDISSGYKLQNVGLGPAIFGGITAKHSDSGEYYKNWESLVRDGLGYMGEYTCSDTPNGSAMGVAVERPLISIPSKLIVEKALPIEFEVCYCSVYEECWVTNSTETSVQIKSCKLQQPLKCQ